MSYLGANGYDLVLSDIHRPLPQEPDAGLALPSLLRESARQSPLAYYVGEATGAATPNGHPVFDSPSALLKHVAAAVEGRG